MIYSIQGKLTLKERGFVVVETGGIGYKVFVSSTTTLPTEGANVSLFCHMRVSENDMSLFGFLAKNELDFFELLITVSGVGARTALAILELGDLESLKAAIKEGRPDLLMKASGIGRKTAERIIVELKNKIVAQKSESLVRKMESDADLVETLVSLGYRREEARAALSMVDEGVTSIEERLKMAFKTLGSKK